jgi:hypothetical protein
MKQVSSRSRLDSVVLQAAQTIDQRHDGYLADVARALKLVLRAQAESPTDAARAREIDKIVESLGDQIRRKSAEI